MLDTGYLRELRDFYLRQLTDDIMPFWVKYSLDRQCGGYHTCLDRDGSVYDYDKPCMWHAGRMIWTFSHLYNELEQRKEWLEAAQWGIDFVSQYGFTPDGSMYYALTREGKPLQGPQDVSTEQSTIIGYTEYARATGETEYYDQARSLFLRVWEKFKKPGQAFQPFNPQTLPVRQHGHSMITINVLNELRRFKAEPDYEDMIDECIDRLFRFHVKPQKRAVLELVDWDGMQIPGSRGRWINPGHMIEGGIFVIQEGKRRKDEKLIKSGVDLIDWGFEWGWDTQYGGIFNDVDEKGLPVPTIDMLTYESKLWWQHAEALHGTLLAYCLTEDGKFLEAYKKTHQYSFTRFADQKYGEWYATLDRRGNNVNYAKGTARKSCFHIARNFYFNYRLLEEIL
jgi:N-acylglucosamine 2-epimerase